MYQEYSIRFDRNISAHIVTATSHNLKFEKGAARVLPVLDRGGCDDWALGVNTSDTNLVCFAKHVY